MWIFSGEVDINVPHDNFPLMIKFLRARSFDVDQAFKLMKEYLMFKVDFPEIFQGIVPSELGNIFVKGTIVISPVKDQHGQTVIMGRSGLVFFFKIIVVLTLQYKKKTFRIP